MALFVTLSKRRLSSASEALETSSRKNTSRLDMHKTPAE